MNKEQNEEYIDELVARTGCFIKNIPNEHDREYKSGFNIVQNTVLQKLIPHKTLSKGTLIQADDYFKGLVFLDYLTNIILGEENIFDNLDIITLVMKKNDKSSLLNMKIITAETGLYIKETCENYLTSENNIKKIKLRYNARNYKYSVDSDELSSLDPYYKSVGLMVCDLVGERDKDELANITAKNELKALVFTSCILDFMKNSESKKIVYDAMKNKDYFTASIIALDGLRKEISLSSLEEYLAESIGGKDDEPDNRNDEINEDKKEIKIEENKATRPAQVSGNDLDSLLSDFLKREDSDYKKKK